MQIGFVGLGRMGGAMTRRLAESGHDVVAYDRSPEAVQAAVALGARAASSMKRMVAMLEPPRAIWVMVPAGDPTEAVVRALAEACGKGDVIVDGGNAYYKDSIRREAELRKRGIAFCDVGVSGGIWGYDEGFCLMAGGPAKALKRLRPIMESLAPEGGFARVGGPGAGHFAKMVHNGIEYGMLQAYGEGFDILNASGYDFDLHALAGLWNRGSVVRSWLLELLERALSTDPSLASVRGYVEDSGEGRWTVQEAMALDVQAPVITLALLERFASRRNEAFSAKVIAALRREFGGHAVREER